MGQKRKRAAEDEATATEMSLVRVTRSMARVTNGTSAAAVAVSSSKVVVRTVVSRKKIKEESAVVEEEITAAVVRTPPKKKIGVFRVSDDELLEVPMQGEGSRKLVGAHMSAAGCVGSAPRYARFIGASAFAFFTRSQRRWDSPQFSQEEIDDFRQACARLGYSSSAILPHGSYLINVGSPDPDTLERSRAALLDEVRRCEALGLSLYNFHPGSTVGECTPAECLARIAESINIVHAQTRGVTLVIENMAGQGNCVGRTFEEIRAIIDGVKDKTRVGVCIDTCHAFAGGYDLSTHDGCRATFDAFERVIGFKYLRGLHLNDSKGSLDCRKDRHENIGKGKIGTACFQFVMSDERFNQTPMVLETPAGLRDNGDGSDGTPKRSAKDAHDAMLEHYRKEIELLYSLEKKAKK